VRAIARDVARLMRPYGDSGRFSDGNFDPPRRAHATRLAELEAALERLIGPDDEPGRLLRLGSG
ncbi:MAG: hypothetical protein HKO98_04140, partial [Gemmatimonadetes bacterium]|nr:hypothetical protein [Gemmatimonadota bacterium]